MSRGTNAGYRYRLIDNALRNTGRKWTFEDLLNHLRERLEEEYDVNLDGNKDSALSPRQLAEDIHIMRKDYPQGYGAPIIRKEGFVYYDDPSYSINNNPLSEIDIENLDEILRLIKPFQALPQLHELETIIGKVKGTISQNVGDQVIELEHNPNAKGLVHLDRLYPIIRDGKEIQVSYQPFPSNEPSHYILHPYLIKEYNNRWFLLGWLPEDDKIKILGLDRIIHFQETGNFVDNVKKEEMQKLQKQIIGVSVDEGKSPVEVKIWVTAAQVPYIKTKPLHNSQLLIDEQTEGSIFSFQLVPNFELEQTLLMFGERVKVLEPTELAEKIKERIKKALDQYND